MSSEAQIRANRLNAQLSTGPSSPEGKARVSANRRTHGLAVSRHLILPGESQAEYDALLEGLTADLNPATALEEVFVHQAAEAHWKLRRLSRYEAEMLARYPNPFLLDDEKIARRFALLARYQAATLRSFHKALEELRRLRATHAKAAQAGPSAGHTVTENEVDHSKPISPALASSSTVCAPAATSAVQPSPASAAPSA